MHNNRKRLIIITFAICAVLILGGALWLLEFLEDRNSITNSKLPELNFYSPDYEVNILDDTEYLELNRIISYRNGPLTITVSPEDYLATDPVLAFLADMIDTMINGNYSEYPNYFSEKYKSENTLPEKFTMQRLYNITVERISEEKDEDGNTLLVYMMDYMISKNDGTLRRDMDSDASRPWYLVIKNENGEYKIYNILTYSNR